VSPTTARVPIAAPPPRFSIARILGSAVAVPIAYDECNASRRRAKAKGRDDRQAIDYPLSQVTGVKPSVSLPFPFKVPRAMRIFLLVLGSLAALLILAQLVMGQLILSGQVEWIKRHQHSGYLTVVVVLVYIGFSLPTIASMPRRNNV
jgi:hypothetical protein